MSDSQLIDRLPYVDAQFKHVVETGQFPEAKATTTFKETNINRDTAIELFQAQLSSRHLDFLARHLKSSQRSFYTIGSSGHEGNAGVAYVFEQQDPAFLHYRSGAFVLARAQQAGYEGMLRDQLLSLMASQDDPVCSGRHKVFGSRELNIIPQTSTIASHLPKAVGTAFAFNRKRILGLCDVPEHPTVLCSFGDASVNHSTAQGAFNLAHWLSYQHLPLPIVFICEDNGMGISVPTPQGWVAETMQSKKGLHYVACDGLNLADVIQASRRAAQIARVQQQPVFLHLRTIRLMGHAGSDVELLYRDIKAIETTEAQDPLLHTARLLLQENYLSQNEICEMYETTRRSLSQLAEQLGPPVHLSSAEAVMRSIVPERKEVKEQATPNVAKRLACLEQPEAFLTQPKNMSQCINLALTDSMLQHDNIVVFGEDVGKKGGVYRVTADLQKRFGKKRVFDSLLDEQSILGMAIGCGQQGLLPIPEIQFLAYLHNAIDQLRGEAATASFFSNGQYTNPMVIRIASLAYQKGFGGHFHNDNAIAAIREIPGIVIACPSNGADAACMMRTAIKLAQINQRIVVFLEPIALYMTKDLHSQGDGLWLDIYPDPKEEIGLGEIAICGESDHLTIVTYGNGYYLSRQAAHLLASEHDINIKVIDIRWLAPLNITAIIEAIDTCANVLLVDECRATGSPSEQIMSALIEHMPKAPKIKRLTAQDSFIPLGDAWQHVLPSKEEIVNVAQAMLRVTADNVQGTEHDGRFSTLR